MINLREYRPPSFFRFVLGPLSWRISILGLALWKSDALVRHLPLDLNSTEAPNVISGMFYSVAGVFGVLAGFIITALTIVASSDSDNAQRMRKNAPSSLPKKLLYAVLTLLILSLSIALAGPIAANVAPIALLGAAVVIALIEVASVSVLVYIVISPRKSSNSKSSFVPDDAM